METLTNMTSKVDDFVDLYNRVLEKADPRTKEWLMMPTPFPTLFLVACYLVMATGGPKLMMNQQPFQIKKLILLYNSLMVVLNLYMAKEVLICVLTLNYSWSCQNPEYRTSEYDMKLANAFWWYYFSKCIEFLDTAFFILKKKEDQLTFLHIYHHSSMFWWSWVGMRFAAAGSTFIVVLFNSCVHVIMYTYYSLSALGPAVQPYLWWKKYLTWIQISQFVVALSLGTHMHLNGCKFEIWLYYSLYFTMITYLMLFINFYHQSYKVKKRKNAFTPCGKTALQDWPTENIQVTNKVRHRPTQTPPNDH